jgi:hypothetical protein
VSEATEIRASAYPEVDDSLIAVKTAAAAWASRSVRARIDLISELRRSVFAASRDWAPACAKSDGLPCDDGVPPAEKVLLGPYGTLRYLRLLQPSLEGVERWGAPANPGRVRTIGIDQTVTWVVPAFLSLPPFPPVALLMLGGQPVAQ